jgi:hypothetical protein
VGNRYDSFVLVHRLSARSCTSVFR